MCDGFEFVRMKQQNAHVRGGLRRGRWGLSEYHFPVRRYCSRQAWRGHLGVLVLVASWRHAEGVYVLQIPPKCCTAPDVSWNSESFRSNL
ncbi:hypothetical protein MRX96_015457 [Rhipicephalus microplus]